ncbi:MAG: hypothetical protein WBQ44_17355 [Rhodococcus sp. (in: high G+C Gram-positive bacteria)]
MRRHLIAITAMALVVGCSNGNGSGGEVENTDPPTDTAIPAAEPAAAPTAEPPAGTIVPLAGAPEGIVITASGTVAVGVREPDGIRLLDTAGTERAFVPTTGSPRHLSLAGPEGPVLAPLEQSDELLLVDPVGAAIMATVPNVGRQPHDAVATADGTIVVTNEMGGGVVFVRDGAVTASLPAGPVQPGGAAAVGNYAAVADVQGNGVWIYGGREQELLTQAPVGTKLTHAVAAGDDLVAFADTDGGAVFVERITPGVEEIARIDAPGKPYGLAYDLQRRLLLITLTESNLLRVVDMADPSNPRTVRDVATVRQPNSIAVDPASGSVFVTGSNPDDESSLQIIPAELVAP